MQLCADMRATINGEILEEIRAEANPFSSSREKLSWFVTISPGSR